MRVFGLFFTCFPLLFLAVGGWLAHGQHTKLTSYEPVEAVVLSREITSSTDSDGGTTYKPIIRYRYTVDGRAYESDQVMPIALSTSSRSWAQSYLDRYPVQEKTTAYVDPGDLAEAFLVREASFFPYVFMLFPMLFVVIGLSLMLVGGQARPSRKLEQAEPGWYRLPPGRSTRHKTRVAMIITAVWCGMGLVVLFHWIMVGGGFSTFPVVALGIYGALAVIPMVMLVRYMAIGRRYGDPIVLVDQPTPRRGETLAVYFEQPTYEHLQLNAVTIGLRLKWTHSSGAGKHRSTTTSVIYEDEEAVARGAAATAGDAVRYSRTIHIPEDRPASDTGFFGARHNWVIHVKTDAASGADYEAEFPILVRD